jgi:hypothetical protein
LEVTAEELKRETDKAKQELAQLQHLRALVMSDFERAVLRLEAALPQSQLRGGW